MLRFDADQFDCLAMILQKNTLEQIESLGSVSDDGQVRHYHITFQAFRTWIDQKGDMKNIVLVQFPAFARLEEEHRYEKTLSRAPIRAQ